MKTTGIKTSGMKLLTTICLLFSSLAGQAWSQNCQAPPSWFPPNQTPRPDDSANFNSNCKFHQWSWQMFLWLTQKTGPNGELRFESFPSPQDLFNSQGSKPESFANRKAYRPLLLSARPLKERPGSSLEEINQAGSNGLLIDQNGRAVYYSQYINKTFYDFVRSKKYYDPTVYLSAPATENFPISSMELKASWKILASGEKFNGYSREAIINPLIEKDDKVVVDTSRTQKVNVGLVGLHVAGVVKNHPEFIWATFEHMENCPPLPSGTDPGSSDPVSDKNWLFYKAKTPAKECNINNANVAVLTDPAKQILAPITQVYLRHLNGGGSASNQANIESLNKSVHSQLKKDSVWKNYYLGGAIWLFPNTLEPNSNLQGNITGSTKLSNATMETFTQQESFRNNCFQCHNTQVKFPPSSASGVQPLPGKNLNISHILVDGYFRTASAKRQKEVRALRAAIKKNNQ